MAKLGQTPLVTKGIVMLTTLDLFSYIVRVGRHHAEGTNFRTWYCSVWNGLRITVGDALVQAGLLFMNAIHTCRACNTRRGTHTMSGVQNRRSHGVVSIYLHQGMDE